MGKTGGIAGTYRVPAGRTAVLGGQQVLVNTGLTAGQLRLYPVLIEIAQPVLTVGVNVTTAGAAGSTLVPAIYSPDANGFPGALLYTATALPTDVIATPSTAFAQTLPVGVLWVGGLHLSAGAAASLTCISRAGFSPWGEFAPTDSLAAMADQALQPTLSALPATFGGTMNAVNSPALYFTT